MANRRKSSDQNDQVMKRSRRSITLEDKMEVIRLMESGEGRPSVCRIMNLPPSTVTTIMKNVKKIKCSMQQATRTSATQVSYSRGKLMEQMEKLLMLWVDDSNQKNIQLNPAFICDKAKSIFDELKERQGGDETFLGSKGWFAGYKSRTRCHNIKMSGETPNSGMAVRAFCQEFQDLVRNGDFSENLIFNVDETRLYWKKMPSMNFDSIQENSIHGFKGAKDTLTLLLGSNASGTLKLKPMLIYHLETPRELNGLNKFQLPVYWRSSKKAWLTQELFLDWYTNHFCVVVYNYCVENNLPPEAILLLDNALGHPPNLDEVQTKLKVKVVYMSQEIIAGLQPMNRGIMLIFKACYLLEFFKTMVNVLNTNTDMTVKDYWQSFSILNAVQFIDIAWEKVTVDCLYAVWKDLLSNQKNSSEGSGPAEETSAVIQEILKLAGEAGLDTIIEDDVLELIVERIGDEKKLSTEELADLAEHLDSRREEKNYEEEPECVMKKIKIDVLERFLANANSLIEGCCEMDHDWERSDFVKNCLNEALVPYREILTERKRKAQQTNMNSCSRTEVQDTQLDQSSVSGPQPGPSL